jgi:sugar lactone lactonase YvrE
MRMHSNGQHSFNRFTHNENDSASLSSNNVYATVEDKHGNIWVATYGGGVNLITTNDGGYKLHNANNTLKDFPKNTYIKIRDIATDKEGNVWAGTTDGLIIMSYKDGKISHEVIEQHPDPKYRMQCNDVVSLGCHPDGTMWIGTNGGGLSHCLGKDENGHYMFDNIGCKDGLPSEEIKGLAFDQDGNIWLSTYHTICSVEPQKRIVTIYSYEDGVDDTMFSEDAAVVLPDGNILFRTLDGWYTVDRKKLVNHSGKTIKLRFTDFYIDNVMMSPRLNDTYSYYVPDSKKVTLPKHNSTFAMSFAALNYNMQGRVHYQYMLEEYDEEWQNADKTLTAEYTQIPSGTYTFKVKAFNLESPDAEEMCTIEITVPSHFLLSTAALWTYLAVAVVIAAILIIAIMRKKRKKLAE